MQQTSKPCARHLCHGRLTKLPDPKSIPVVHWFYGFPLENYASYDPLYFANQRGEIICKLLPSGMVTQVPSHLLPWNDLPGSARYAHREYGEPIELPDGCNSVAVINESTYHALHVWNANCGRYEKIDLSWMVILGPVCQTSATPSDGAVYSGLIIPPEAKANRTLVSDELRRRLTPPKIDHLPEV